MGGKDLGKTSTGMQPNVAALLSYLIGFITGIIFYMIEKENKFVRFHAMQSIIAFGALTIAYWIFGFIPFLNLIAYPVLGALGLILWIILMVKAYQGQMFKLPVIGDIAEKQVGK